MMCPEERYLSDPLFHNMVDSLEEQIHIANCTPTEIRQAAILACIHHEMRCPRYLISPDIEKAFETLENFRRVNPIDLVCGKSAETDRLVEMACHGRKS